MIGNINSGSVFIFGGYDCAKFHGPRSRWEQEELGHATSIESTKSEAGMAVAMVPATPTDFSGVWNRKERTPLRLSVLQGTV